MSSDQGIYSDRYIAFVDILGFSNTVRNSITSPRQASELVKALDRNHDRWVDPALKSTHGVYDADFKVTTFSDCTVMSVASTPTDLQYLLLMVTQFALDLMSNGLFVRGGIAKGLLYHSEKAVFGPAFLDAYALEHEIALYPRIVVDKNTHLDYEKNPIPEAFDEFILPALRYDEDGPIFVDVLAAYRITERTYPSRVLLTGGSIRACIQNQFNNSIYNPDHYKKLKWLAMYWNSVRLNCKIVDRLERIDFPMAKDWRRVNGLES